MRLSLRQVEAFRAVLSTGSMTAAAELMGVTQPAVSRLIRDMEAEIGVSLFERIGGRIMATQDAFALYREVERSFVGLDSIAKAADALRNRREGYLRVAASIAPSFYCLPDVIDAFQADWPGVKVTLKTCSSPEVRNLVALHQADLGIASAPPGTPGVDIEALADLDMVCVLPAGHALCAERVIRPRHLAGERLLMIADHSVVQQRIRKAFDAAGIQPDVAFETSFSGPICSLVARRRGIAIVEPLTAHAYRALGLEIRPFEPTVRYELKAMYPAGQARGDRTRAFVHFLRRDLKTLVSSPPAGEVQG